jgi:hypothetical protein
MRFGLFDINQIQQDKYKKKLQHTQKLVFE